jgi:hypothetical protein
MSKHDGLTVTILNWEKYNPRKDVQSPSWFRFQHNLFENWQFYDFDPAELVAWIYLLCEASKRGNKGKVTVNFEHAHRIGRVASTALNSAIKKLKANQVIETRTLRGRYADVINTGTTNETERDETNETRRNETNAQASASGVPTPTGVNPEGESPGAKTWREYKAAYRERHGDAPLWNAKTAGMLKNFIARVPADEAPAIAAFYVGHNDRFYVQAMHPVGLLLRDAEKLRTEWATGNRMTAAKAKNSETVDYANDQLRRIAEGTL